MYINRFLPFHSFTIKAICISSSTEINKKSIFSSNFQTLKVLTPKSVPNHNFTVKVCQNSFLHFLKVICSLGNILFEKKFIKIQLVGWLQVAVQLSTCGTRDFRGIALLGVFLRVSSPYLHEVLRKPRKIPKDQIDKGFDPCTSRLSVLSIPTPPLVEFIKIRKFRHCFSVAHALKMKMIKLFTAISE